MVFLELGAGNRRLLKGNAIKRVPVICLQCGLSVDRLVGAKTAQIEIHRVTYQQKCKVEPDAADLDCPELEHAVERSRRWDPILRSGMSRPATNDDAVMFPDALLEAGEESEARCREGRAERRGGLPACTGGRHGHGRRGPGHASRPR
jgi:hypothetical protein